MNKRPVAVTTIGFLFIAAGLVGLAYHLPEWKAPHPLQHQIFWVSLVRLIAVICGAFILRGSNWARWVAVIWIAYHLVLSVFHPILQLALHGLLFAVIAYVLFRRSSNTYFQAVAN